MNFNDAVERTLTEVHQAQRQAGDVDKGGRREGQTAPRAPLVRCDLSLADAES